MPETEAKIPNPKFNSPLPFIIQLRNLLFGKVKPGIYTQITFYINLVGAGIFGLWNAISYFAISYRTVFFEQKGVDVAAIIDRRGIELGFQSGDFMNRLSTFHGISMVCWLLILVGLVLLWRRRSLYVYFFFVPFIFYFGMMVFYISFTYFLEDTTAFDKVLLLVIFLNTLIYQLFATPAPHSEDEEAGEELRFFD